VWFVSFPLDFVLFPSLLLLGLFEGLGRFSKEGKDFSQLDEILKAQKGHALESLLLVSFTSM
jgi:hypothetical protein